MCSASIWKTLLMFCKSVADKLYRTARSKAESIAETSLIDSISCFMALPFVHGWCENPMVSRSGKAPNTVACNHQKPINFA